MTSLLESMGDEWHTPESLYDEGVRVSEGRKWRTTAEAEIRCELKRLERVGAVVSREIRAEIGVPVIAYRRSMKARRMQTLDPS